MMMLPDRVVHADWSLNPKKRVMVVADLEPNGRYHIHTAPQPVGHLHNWHKRLKPRPDASLFIGVDIPIGLPVAYAEQVGITDFVAWLPTAGHGEWAQFYEVAQTREEIGLKRPFYPQRPSQTRQQHLLDALNVSHMDQLRRQCELPTPQRRAAAPLFWTMGAQQVGKAAITGWRDWLTQALVDGAVIWPFAGTLRQLIQPHATVIAEAYPAEFAVQFGLIGSKRKADDRQQNAPHLLMWAKQLEVSLADTFQQQLHAGFDGEDSFDATVGLLGMIHTLQKERHTLSDVPLPDYICQIEGWILGQYPYSLGASVNVTTALKR